MGPVVALENKTQGQPFDKQGQNPHIPFFFIGYIIGYGLLQFFFGNIFIHLAAHRGQDGFKTAVPHLFPIVNAGDGKEVGSGVGAEKCPEVDGQVHAYVARPGCSSHIGLADGPDKTGRQVFGDADTLAAACLLQVLNADVSVHHAFPAQREVISLQLICRTGTVALFGHFLVVFQVAVFDFVGGNLFGCADLIFGFMA